MKKIFGAAGAALICSLGLFASPAKADVDGSCAGKSLIFFPGGGEGDTFASIVYRGAKSGDKAMVWGLLGQQGRGERTKGIVDALKAKGVNVQYLEISDAVNNDPSQGVPVFSAFYASNPDLKAVITDHGTLTATIPLYFKNAKIA